MQNIDEMKIINADPEKSTEFNISIQKFDPESAYLELPEELDQKMLTYIEREVRNSYEYRAYIGYLKNELDLTRCSLLPNLDINSEKFSLEFHHYPMNLFEIAQAVGTQMIANCKENEKVSCFDISQKIVEEHYKNNIGLVPLSKTMHDMAHNKTIIVPISKVYGDYKSFVKKYQNYIPTDILDRIHEAEMNSDSDDAKAYNNAKLEKNISRYNIEYTNDDDEDSSSMEVA